MSDETKLEGDNLLEFELANVVQAAQGLPLLEERAWARGQHEYRRVVARGVLAWAREHLAAPAAKTACAQDDDAIALAMYNAVEYRKTNPLTMEEWKQVHWELERDNMHRALAWVRAHLVAPAVAEAQKEHWKERL